MKDILDTSCLMKAILDTSHLLANIWGLLERGELNWIIRKICQRSSETKAIWDSSLGMQWLGKCYGDYFKTIQKKNLDDTELESSDDDIEIIKIIPGRDVIKIEEERAMNYGLERKAKKGETMTKSEDGDINLMFKDRFDKPENLSYQSLN